MSVGEKSESVLDDVEFIQKNYSDYFESLHIRQRSTDRVLFDVIPSKAVGRTVTVELNKQAFVIISDSDKSESFPGSMYESFEQLMAGIMGDHEFSEMLTKLTIKKLSKWIDS